MKFSIWSSFFIELTPEKMVLEFERNGVKYSELSDEHAIMLMNRGDPTEIGSAFKSFAQAHNVSFPQGHLILKARICMSEFVDLLIKQLDLFKAIGVKNAVLHVDSNDYDGENTLDEKRANNLKALRVLVEHIKDTDMVICLENLRDKSITKSADDLLFFVNEINSPNLGICLDTGHLNLCDGDQASFIEKAGKHLKALHIQDNDGSGDQHIMPFGKGNVDLYEVVTSAKKIGYDGLYNLEIPGENRCPLEVKRLKIDYLKKMFELVDNETNS